MSGSGAVQGMEALERAGGPDGTGRADPRLRKAAHGFEALLWGEVLRAALSGGLSQDAGAGGAV